MEVTATELKLIRGTQGHVSQNDRIRMLDNRVAELKQINSGLRESLRLKNDELVTSKREMAKLSDVLNKTLLDDEQRIKEKIDSYSYLPKRDAIFNIVVNECAIWGGVKEAELCKKSRKRLYVVPRQMTHYILYKKMKGYTLQEIGKRIGEVGHSTVLNSCKTVSNLVEIDRNFRDAFNKVYAQCLKRIMDYDEERGEN